MSHKENDYAAFIDEAALIETEGEQNGGWTPVVGATIAVSLRFCPTSACTRSC